MNIAGQLTRMVELAAEERLSIDDLYGWLAENVQTIADADDADAKALADQAWIAVCEWQDSLRADSDVRIALAGLLDARRTVRSAWSIGGAHPAVAAVGSGTEVAHGRIHFAERFTLVAVQVDGSRAAVPARSAAR